MELITLLFFVLILLIAALIVTQTIRRDFKALERNAGGTRPGPAHAHTHAAQRALHSPPSGAAHANRRRAPFKISER